MTKSCRGSSGTLCLVVVTLFLAALGTAQAAPIISVQSLAVAKSAIGGMEVSGIVTLNAAAPRGGFEVALASLDSAASVPPSVIVAELATSAKFIVRTQPVEKDTAVIIEAGNPVAAKAQLMVLAPTVLSVTLGNSAPTGGEAVAGTVTLSGAAPAPGMTVPLQSSNAAGKVPSSIDVKQGLTAAPFTVSTQPVAWDTSVNIYAGPNLAAKTATLTVKAPAVSAVSFPAATVIGGQPITGTINMSGAAPFGGLQVPLSSSNPNAAYVPANVTVGAGLNSAEFMLSSNAVSVDTPATIAAGSGRNAKTAQITVTGPPSVTSLTLNIPSVIGGGFVTATVALSRAAPTGGLTVPLSGSDPTHTPLPPHIAFGVGQSSASFIINTQPVAADTNVTITAGHHGASQTEQLTIHAPTLIGFQLNLPTTPQGPWTVRGGMEVAAFVNINGPAPAGGFDIPLTSDSPAASVPGFVKIPEGQNSSMVTIYTQMVTADTPATISAGPPSSPKTLALIVGAHRVASVTVDPPYVAGGSNITGTITIDSFAPASGLQVSVTSSQQPNATPQILTVPGGMDRTTFLVPSIPVSVHTLVTITARMSMNEKSGQVLVTAPIVIALNLFATTTTGGTPVNASLTLNGPAPAGGFDVPLESSDPVATVPASVRVAESQTTAVFTVTTQPVSGNILVTISAGAGPVGPGLAVNTAFLMVTPPPPP